MTTILQMTTVSDLIEKWKLLAKQAGPSDLLRVFPDHPLDVYVRLSSSTEYELLVVAKDVSVEEFFTTGLKNIHVSVTLMGGDAKVCLTLKSLSLLNTFASMCFSLVSKSNQFVDKRNAFFGLLGELENWVELLKRKQDGEMTRAEAIGLWGELVVVRELVLRDGLHADAIVQAWRGPNGDKTDIGLEGRRIEVKTQLATKAASLRITSLEQLDRDSEELYVILNRISPSREGISLVGLIEEVASYLFQNNSAHSDFEKKIEITSFSPKCKYAQERYFLDHSCAYFVDDSFPALTHRNVPYGIERAEYVIGSHSISDHQLSMETLMGRLNG